MYTPPAFAETDVGKIHDFIEQHSFATVVTVEDGTAVASHLPILLNRHDGPHGQLIGHMARANPQWRQANDRPVLVIFNGPHAYISPTWYEAQNVVPTWNYSAVHAYGKFRIVDEKERRLDIVRRYVEFYESRTDPPWSIDTVDECFLDSLLDAIVGFEIDVERFEGKWKLSQNHDEARRTKVISALRKAGGENNERIAAAMSQTLES